MPDTETAPQTGYAPVNGLQMYNEIHGAGGIPLQLRQLDDFERLWEVSITDLAQRR